MKKLIGLFLFFGLAYANVDWVDSYKEAQKRDKPIFVYIAQKGCPACAYMDKTLGDPKIYAYLNQHFVSFKYDIHQSKGLPRELHSTQTPTLHFVDQEGNKIIPSYSGGKNVEGFYQMLQRAIH
ncbi:MAG: hypothetical protein KU38_01915 [Sulfurovum sp. FS08-3]|nr:MAG: hypothetical protein KU38_01915 [Sulfurovum sp. FS08-3]